MRLLTLLAATALAFTSCAPDTTPVEEPVDVTSAVDTVDTFVVRKKQTVQERKEQEADKKEVQTITGDANKILRQGEPETSTTSTTTVEPIVLAPDEPAMFPGGPRAYETYLKKNLHYPPIAFENEVRGVVIVRFIVEKNGKRSGTRVIRGLGYGCDENALSFVNAMPDWIPAQKSNQPVRTQIDLSLSFDPGH